MCTYKIYSNTRGMCWRAFVCIRCFQRPLGSSSLTLYVHIKHLSSLFFLSLFLPYPVTARTYTNVTAHNEAWSVVISLGCVPVDQVSFVKMKKKKRRKVYLCVLLEVGVVFIFSLKFEKYYVRSRFNSNFFYLYNNNNNVTDNLDSRKKQIFSCIKNDCNK